MVVPRMTNQAQGKINPTLLETMNRVSEKKTPVSESGFKLKKYDI